MVYQSQNELQQRAELYIAALQAVQIEANIVPDSARDYLLKVAIHRNGQAYGLVSLHHSPKKNSFKITVNEIRNPAIAAELQGCWQPTISSDQSPPTDQPLREGWAVYVDGSFITERIGYGAVILQNGILAHELSGSVDDSTLQSMHQVAGELTATIEALTWCSANGVTEIIIYYDYTGIEAWATGAWKANFPFTQQYAALVNERAQAIAIHWQKVISHTGNQWNDHADALAKRAALAANLPVDTTSTTSEQSTPTSDRQNLQPTGVFALIEDRYQRLSPYREDAIDFSDLAHALQQVYVTLHVTMPDFSAMRYNFDGLESAYIALKQGYSDG